MKRNKLLLIALLIVGCQNPSDSAPPPETTEISGIVTFSGDWPTEGTVYLTINNKGAPVGAPYATTTITSADLDNSGKYEYQFKDVAFGTYGAITVSWLDPNNSNPATNQHILGGYGGSVQSGFMDSKSVTVSEEEYELKGIDISANFDLLGPSYIAINFKSYSACYLGICWVE